MKGNELKKIRLDAGLTQEELGKKLGVTKRTIISYEKEGEIPDSKVKLIHFIFNVSQENYALRDIETYQKSNVGDSFTPMKNGKLKILVKKVPVSEFPRYILNHDKIEYFEDLEDISFIVDRLEKGRYLSFEVSDDSMNGGRLNDTPLGSDILCHELQRKKWQNKLDHSKYGWVIIHKTTILFKDLTDFDVSTGEITCSSRSGLPQHADFKILLQDVEQIFKIIKRTF